MRVLPFLTGAQGSLERAYCCLAKFSGLRMSGLVALTSTHGPLTFSAACRMPVHSTMRLPESSREMLTVGGSSAGGGSVIMAKRRSSMPNLDFLYDADGVATGAGDVVAIYVGEELRAKQEVSINEGVAWLPNALVNAAGGEETIRFKVYDSSSGVTYGKSGSNAVITPGVFVGTYAEPLMIRMDSVAPVLTLLGDAQVTIDQGSTYVDAGASAVDNVDGDLTDKIVVSGEVDASTAGTYTLRYDVSDAVGNAAQTVSRTVVVEKGTVTQSLSLKKGWNLVSFYPFGLINQPSQSKSLCLHTRIFGSTRKMNCMPSLCAGGIRSIRRRLRFSARRFTRR